MNPIATILQAYPAVLLDGALATELERRGCDLGDPLWSARLLIEQPERIRAIHADYFAAGADCAISASYHPDRNGWSGEADCAAFGEQARGWVAAGARVVGGCCRTTPAHIREIASWLRG